MCVCEEMVDFGKLNCEKNYIDETQRNQEKRIYELERLINLNDGKNTSFVQMSDLKLTFNFSQATLLKTIYCKNISQSFRIFNHFQSKTH